MGTGEGPAQTGGVGAGGGPAQTGAVGAGGGADAQDTVSTATAMSAGVRRVIDLRFNGCLPARLYTLVRARAVPTAPSGLALELHFVPYGDDTWNSARDVLGSI